MVLIDETVIVQLKQLSLVLAGKSLHHNTLPGFPVPGISEHWRQQMESEEWGKNLQFCPETASEFNTEQGQS